MTIVHGPTVSNADLSVSGYPSGVKLERPAQGLKAGTLNRSGNPDQCQVSYYVGTDCIDRLFDARVDVKDERITVTGFSELVRRRTGEKVEVQWTLKPSKSSSSD